MGIVVQANRPVLGRDFAPLQQKDNYLKRMVRLCIYKFAVLISFFERLLLNITHHSLLGRCFLWSKEKIDFARIERGTEVMKSLGGEVKYILPEDREGYCELMHLKPQNLKQKIEALGGRWEKRRTQEGVCLAIVFPKEPSRGWNDFYETALKKTPWEEAFIGSDRVLITARNADLIRSDSKTKCIFHADLATPYQLNRNRFFHYVGMQRDVICYNGRGMFSPGYPSEAGTYVDADACFKYASQQFQPHEICITGSCGDTVVGGFLFSRYHQAGVNAFFENFPLSIPEVIRNQNCLASWIGMRYLRSIQTPEHSKLHRYRHRYPEDQFNTCQKFEKMERGSGYAIFASSVGDKMAPPENIKKMADIVTSKGSRVLYLKNDPTVKRAGRQNKDPHMSRPYANPELQRDIMTKMFAPSLISPL